ncbi:MAG: response regulator transcription factor [Nitrospira sp.]|nr:response regulator transcription factor [Nitrospira sp.]
MNKPRVLLADDHGLVLAGLRRLVEDSCEVVGTVEDGRALIEAAQRLEPDLILLDIAMPLLNGIDAARQIRKLCPNTKLIFLTMQTSPTYATEAFQAGASGYLLKRSAPMELPLAIEAVLRGQHYLTPAIARPVLEKAIRPDTPSTFLVKRSPSDLTPRQREVLQLVGEGKTTKEIATLLNISVKTVEFHKARLMEELDLHTTAELMRYAITQGLASPEP